MKKTRLNRLAEIVMACMLAVTVSAFNACKEEDDGIRIPGDDEVLTKDIVLEEDPWLRIVIEHEMWGKKGTFKDVPVTIHYGGIECYFIFLNKEQVPCPRQGYEQHFIIPESKEKELNQYWFNHDTITICGDYKYVYTKHDYDAPNSLEYSADCFNLDLTEIKKYE